MCFANQQPVGEYSPCSGCNEFLSTCMPIIVYGMIYGECDYYDFCEWCSYHEDCEERSC